MSQICTPHFYLYSVLCMCTYNAWLQCTVYVCSVAAEQVLEQYLDHVSEGNLQSIASICEVTT